MWGRVVEIMTAVWLMASPFIFAAQDREWILWGDIGTAALIVGLSGLSFWPRLGKAHLAILLVAVGLVLVGRFSEGVPPSPVHQNHIFVGFFLMMIAIIPNQASQPPSAWRLASDTTRCK